LDLAQVDVIVLTVPVIANTTQKNINTMATTTTNENTKAKASSQASLVVDKKSGSGSFSSRRK
jgi:hypothetical protein